MIQMLCRFDLKPGVSPQIFARNYAHFVQSLQHHGIAERATPVGQRLTDTPMDTDVSDAPDHYTIITFRNRAQLDQSYACFSGTSVDPTLLSAHSGVTELIENAVFTCWHCDE